MTKIPKGVIGKVGKAYTGLWACPRATGAYIWRYPAGLMKRCEKYLGIPIYKGKTLHLFSGSSQIGVTVDINPQVNPDYVLDLLYDKLPFSDNSFDVVLADPPYNEFPPYCFVDEAIRVLKPNGYFVVLHFLVYKTPHFTTRKAVIAVTTGSNMRIRALCVFQKKPMLPL